MGSDGKAAGRACPAPTAQPLLQLKIPNYQQLQACVRVGNKPLGLVQNGFSSVLRAMRPLPFVAASSACLRSK